MSDPESTPEATKDRLLQAAMGHVAFDGWSETTFRAAVTDSGVDARLARALFPRGGIDLAVAFHKAGDRAMADRIAATDLSAMRYRDKVAFAIRARLEAVQDREAVRRGTTLFALPQNAPEGAKLIWDTADAIWTVLGDTSRDLNWYTKRASLSAVYGSTVLFWLGDDSPGHQATWDFLDRRIEGVMQFEKVKAAVTGNPVAKAVLAGPAKLMEKLKAPVVPEGLAERFTSGRFR